MPDDGETIVRTLLSAAGLDLPDEEVANLARSYPDLRAAADALYEPDVDRHAPAPLPTEPELVP